MQANNQSQHADIQCVHTDKKVKCYIDGILEG